MSIEDIIKKYNYSDEIASFLRSVYPILVEYFSNEEIVYYALLTTPIKLTDNVYTCLVENGFLKNKYEDEMVPIESLKFSSGAYHSEPIIRYEKGLNRFVLDDINRIIAINASSLELDTTKATLIHEICHSIKSYCNEYTINADTIVEKSGLMNKIYQLSENYGIVHRKTIYLSDEVSMKTSGLGLEEGLNAIAEEEITSKLLGVDFNTKGYQTMKSIAKDILSYNIPNLKEHLIEAELYHDTTRLNSTLGETYYKILDFTDNVYPNLVKFLNPNTQMIAKKEAENEIIDQINKIYKPIIQKELESIGNKSIGY